MAIVALLTLVLLLVPHARDALPQRELRYHKELKGSVELHRTTGSGVRHNATLSNPSDALSIIEFYRTSGNGVLQNSTSDTPTIPHSPTPLSRGVFMVHGILILTNSVILATLCMTGDLGSDCPPGTQLEMSHSGDGPGNSWLG